MESTQLISLSRRAFRGEVGLEAVVEAIQDLSGQLDEARAALRYIAARTEDRDTEVPMRRAEGLLYGADLAIGMAIGAFTPDDAEDGAGT